MADEKKIAGLIKNQFPAFYNEEGPLFIDFVTAYYEWMESETPRRNKKLGPPATVAVVYGSANIVGTNTAFTDNFSNGDSIAISRSDDDYEIFTIDVVSNSTFLTISTGKLPSFAHVNTIHGNVHIKANPAYYVRRTQEMLDIDTTTDDFIVWFKETYLKNIQFSTSTDTQTMIKNSLDLYRSKGTPRSVDLLFKATFGTPASVYYPGTDLMRLSSGKWVIPKYLELSPNEQSTKLVSTQIVGQTSGAVAYCDSLIRRTVQGKIVDIAYISAISGDFQTGEVVNSKGKIIAVEEAPFITGSLNSVIIVNGDEGQAIGDLLTLTSDNGVQGVGRVTGVTNATGGTSLALANGGYAYSYMSNVHISDVILKIEDIRSDPTQKTYFDPDLFDAVYQPSANITYSAATSALTLGDDIFTYHANTDLDGTGAIIGITAVNSSAGELQIKILSGSMNNVTFYTTANAISANADVYADTTAVGNVVGMYDEVLLQLSGISGTFVASELATTPLGGSGVVSFLSNTSGSGGTLSIINTTSAYHQSNVITGQTSGATATIGKIDLQFGVENTTNAFIITSNNYFFGNSADHAVNGEITFVSSGSGFTFGISNTFLYPETISYATDMLDTNTSHYLPLAINAVQYDFPADTTANLTSNTIQNMLSYSSIEVGMIQTLTAFNAGINYNRLPIVKVVDPITSTYHIPDYLTISYSNTTSSFSVGELVTQSDTNFRAMVLTQNSTIVTTQRLFWDGARQLIPTVNAITRLVGSDSGASANVDTLLIDGDSNKLGSDATFLVDSSIANGVATSIEIKDSGFGYIGGETLTFGFLGGSVIAQLSTHGTAAGFYASQDGFLSNKKKLYDGEYWQNHSYEIRASVAIDKYQDMLKQVVHVIGTGMFGNLVHESTHTYKLNQVANTGSNTVISA
jgi:hypothetical protein